MTEKIKSLGEIVGDTAVKTAIFYPLYAGVMSFVHQQNFVDTLQDGTTLSVTAGVALGNTIYDLCKRYNPLRNK